MATGNIEIKFRASGNKKLKKAIEDLDKVTKDLNKTTRVARKRTTEATKAQKKLRENTQRITAANKGAGKSFLGLGGTLSVARSQILLFSFAAGLVTTAVRTLTNTVAATREFEVLKTRLESITGSAIKAEVAFQTFNEVAAKTPFTLRDITNAGVALKAFGADAEETIVPVADLAAFMGVNATEAAQAFGRAFAGGAGAADILRERGVLALVKSFHGVDDLSKKTLPQFRKMLIETMQDPTAGIAGATEKLSQTFEGAYSNMVDSATRLAAAFGQSLSPTLMRFMRRVTKGTTALREFFEVPDEFADGQIAYEKRQNKLANITLKDLEKSLKKAKKELADFTGTILDTGESTDIADGQIISFGGDLAGSTNSLADGIITTGEYTDKTADLAESLKKQGIQLEIVTDFIDDVSKAYSINVSEMMVVSDEVVRLAGNVTDLEAAVRKKKEELANLPHVFIRFRKEIEEAMVSVSIYTNAVNGVADAYMAMRKATIDSDKQVEISAANGIRSERRRQRELDKINKKYEEKQKEANKEAQRIKRAQTVVNTGVAVMEALSAEKPGFPGNFLVAALVAAQGHLQLKTIDAAKYEQGGMVGGRRHSQGGTMIEAEKGEYVVSRRGVDAVGIEALNRINSGGAGGINVSINNPILSKDVVEDDLIPQIKEAIRRGADIGVG
tara:strand:- start:66 stop:2090 length:2025 start_codon:yes stop_codon:yes gene_type:complete